MICTFYSYKGGVGRSMALANVADIMARRGLRVLMIDFDLEAPGLEQFFPVNQPRVREHEGLLDLLLSYKRSMADTADEEAGLRPFEQLEERFILHIYDNLQSGGRLDLLPAGQRETEEQLSRYALSLRTFDWQDFYFNWAGEAFFEWLRNSLLKPSPSLPEPYDIVLVDSRTGVTEMGGICAYQLADSITMFCAPNHQNVEGTRNMIENFHSSRVQSLRRNRPLKVMVAPGRTEKRDQSLLNSFRERFSKAFDEFIPTEFTSHGWTFWDLLIPYEPRYAFEEQVVSQQKRMTAAFEKLVTAIGFLADPEKQAKLAQLTSSDKTQLPLESSPQQFDATRSIAGHDVFLSFHQDDEAEAKELARQLQTQLKLDVFLDSWSLVKTEPWRAKTEESLFNSKSCFILIGKAGLGLWQSTKILAALEESIRERGLRLVPVILPGGREQAAELPDVIERSQYVDFQEVVSEEGLPTLRLLTNFNKAESETVHTVVDYGPPYVGLRAFDEKHAQLFYGREALVRQAIEQMRGGNSFALSGPSGCGKSSLIKAGLFPALRRDELPGSSGWRVLSMRPGAEPLDSLASTISKLNFKSAEHVGRTDMIDALKGGNEALDALLKTHFAEDDSQSGLAERRVILFVDQFEETFTMCQDAGQRERFIDNLMYAARSPHNQFTLIVSLRSDFISNCAEYPQMATWLQSNLFLVPPMSRDELREAIERPAQKVGLAFEPGLVERILDDVSTSPGALPLLQFLLLQLWENRREGFMTMRAYEESGGVTKAIALRAEAIFNSFTPEQRVIARRVLLRLIQPSTGTEDTRRRASMKELITTPEERESVEEIVVHLVEARLLTTDGDQQSGEDWVEISHEALIRGWPRLRQWIDKERDDLHVRLRLTEEASIWQRAKKDEGILYRGARLHAAISWQSRHKAELNDLERAFLSASIKQDQRNKFIVSSLKAAAVLIFVAMIALTVFAFRQRTYAFESAEQARALAKQAQESSERAETARREAEEANKRSKESLAKAEAATTAAEDAKNKETAQRKIAEDANIKTAHALDKERVAKGEAEKRRLEAVAAAEVADASKELAYLNQLAAQAVSVGKQQPNLLSTSVMLAAESMKPKSSTVNYSAPVYSPPAYQALSDGLALLPTPFRPLERKGLVTGVAFSPDGRSVLTMGREEGEIDYSAASLWVWDAESGTEVISEKPRGPVDSMVQSPDRKYIATLNHASGLINLWRWDENNLRKESDLKGILPAAFNPFDVDENEAFAISSDRKYLAKANASDVAVWDVSDASAIRELKPLDQGKVTKLEFNPKDNGVLATVGEGGVVSVWNLNGSSPSVTPIKNIQNTVSLAFSNDGKLLAAGDINGVVRVIYWNENRLFAIIRHEERVQTIAFSDNGQLLATTSNNGIGRVWDLARPQPREVARLAEDKGISAITFNHDGNYVATASADSARVWKVPGQPGSVLVDLGGAGGSARSTNGQYLVTRERTEFAVRNLQSGGVSFLSLPSDSSYFSKMAVSNDGQLLAAAFDLDPFADEGKSILLIWDGNREPGSTTTKEITEILFSPDNNHLAIATRGGSVELRDVKSKRTALTINYGADINSMAFDASGQHLAIAGDNGACIWDITSGNCGTLVKAGKKIKYVTLSPQGDYLVTVESIDFSTAETTADIWALPTGRFITTVEHPGNIHHLAITQDGKYLATAAGLIARVWSLSNGELVSTMHHADEVRYVAFSSDGKYLATASDDNTARVWKVGKDKGCETAHVTLPNVDRSFFDEADSELFAFFNPDDKYLVAGSAVSAQMRIWEPQALLDQVCSHVTRNLSADEWYNKYYLIDRPLPSICPTLPQDSLRQESFQAACNLDLEK